ncbi:hypothetical protein [Rickettsia endosymbiont of Orchestes rusci]
MFFLDSRFRGNDIRHFFDVIPVKTRTQPCLCHAELVSASIKRYPEINSG